MTINWAWESYKIIVEYYAAVEKPGGNVIDETYYEKYMQVIEQKLKQAGCPAGGGAE